MSEFGYRLYCGQCERHSDIGKDDPVQCPLCGAPWPWMTGTWTKYTEDEIDLLVAREALIEAAEKGTISLEDLVEELGL